MHQNGNDRDFQSGECTKLVRDNGSMPCREPACTVNSARKRKRSKDMRRVFAAGRHRWHNTCFIGADRFVPAEFSALRRRTGGRAGAGQLDWAAAESAEFVNQEIGYE
jgi:3',5'-cyclic AMP phosphodiesterase CpdA